MWGANLVLIRTRYLLPLTCQQQRGPTCHFFEIFTRRHVFFFINHDTEYVEQEYTHPYVHGNYVWLKGPLCELVETGCSQKMMLIQGSAGCRWKHGLQELPEMA